MNDRLFSDIPKDDSTHIIKRTNKHFSGLNILEEWWTWEGISGRSLIIPLNEIEGLTDQRLIEILSENYSITHPHTLQRRGRYLFINYDFTSSY